MRSAFDLREEEFGEKVLASDTPVLLEFWAPWCGPCNKIAPLVGEVVERFEGKVRLFRMNTDECTELPQRLEVASIPTLILFAGGAEIARFAGRRAVEGLQQGIEAALAGAGAPSGE